MIAGRTRLRALFERPVLPVRAGMVCLGIAMMLWFGGALAFAQGRFTEVLVSVVKNKVFAVNGVGPSEIDLGVGETVVSTKAFGLTGLAITSTRLLGFSSQLRHWGEQPLSVDEHVNQSQVLRELCVVVTEMGFRKPSRIGRPRASACLKRFGSCVPTATWRWW